MTARKQKTAKAPWKVIESMFNGEKVYDVYNVDDEQICEVCENDTARFDAAMIAKAPVMLNLLKTVISSDMMSDDNPIAVEIRKIIKEIA